MREHARQQQAAADPQINQTAQANTLTRCEPFHQQRRDHDKDQAVADAVAQAQQGNEGQVIGDGQAEQGEAVQGQRYRNAALDLLRLMPADGGQRTQQVAEVIPAG